MSVQQKWILSSSIGGLLLLLFPPFLYGPSGAGRQWHFFLDSRRTSYTTHPCKRAYDIDDVIDAIIERRRTARASDVRSNAAREKCLKEKPIVERGITGRVDVAFLLLEMVIVGVSLFTGYYIRIVGLQRGGGNISAWTTQLRNNVTTSANRVSPPTQASE
jgi:hypothetical protein